MQIRLCTFVMFHALRFEPHMYYRQTEHTKNAFIIDIHFHKSVNTKTECDLDIDIENHECNCPDQ